MHTERTGLEPSHVLLQKKNFTNYKFFWAVVLKVSYLWLQSFSFLFPVIHIFSLMFFCGQVYCCYFHNADRDMLIDVSIGQRVAMDL